MKLTVLNFSSYQLSEEEYWLDYHIQSKTNNNVINTEFEKFNQSILSNISHIPEDQLAVLKTRTLVTNTTTSMYLIDTKKIIGCLSNKRKDKVLRQDKGCRVVIMDISQYMNKFLNMLNNDNFIKLNDNPTKSIKRKPKEQLERLEVSLVKMNAIKFITQVLSR